MYITQKNTATLFFFHRYQQVCARMCICRCRRDLRGQKYIHVCVRIHTHARGSQGHDPVTSGPGNRRTMGEDRTVRSIISWDISSPSAASPDSTSLAHSLRLAPASRVLRSCEQE